MVYVMGALVVLAVVLMASDLRTKKDVKKIREDVRELTKRVNVNDEVITLHSEEIDEIQRHELAKKIVREMLEQSGKECVINTGKGDDHGQSM